MAKKKTALFGGTFDPIHLAHIAVATAAVKEIGAEEVVFIPAKHSPLKDSLPQATDVHRLKMITYAIEENENFKVSDYELKKPGQGYTLETVRKFQADYGKDAVIYWLVGADGVDDLLRWSGIRELIDECNLSVMYRAGYAPPDFSGFTAVLDSGHIEKLRRNVIQTPLINISSTEIRDKLAAGQDVSGMLHPSVADYIRKHGLYQPRSKN